PPWWRHAFNPEGIAEGAVRPPQDLPSDITNALQHVFNRLAQDFLTRKQHQPAAEIRRLRYVTYIASSYFAAFFALRDAAGRDGGRIAAADVPHRLHVWLHEHASELCGREWTVEEVEERLKDLDLYRTLMQQLHEIPRPHQAATWSSSAWVPPNWPALDLVDV